MGLEETKCNVQDAISLLHVAEGGMGMIGEKLQRLRQLATQAATQTCTSAERVKIQMEVDQLVAEIDRLASAIQFKK
ncbi:TPA: hypothetical protein DCX15_00985 [bacterium]|nr:hypothetical protein [bacterium]